MPGEDHAAVPDVDNIADTGGQSLFSLRIRALGGSGTGLG